MFPCGERPDDIHCALAACALMGTLVVTACVRLLVPAPASSAGLSARPVPLFPQVDSGSETAQ